MWPCRDDSGQWSYTDLMGRAMDKARFEEWKTIFYRLEGWDPRSGWPTRSGLEALGLRHVADALQAAGRLGKEDA